MWVREWPNVSFMFYVILCFFTTNTRKKIVNHCVFLYFLTPWCRCARRQYWGLVLLGLFFFYFLGFVVSVWWGPNSTGNPLWILRVFVFFFSYKRKNAQGNPLFYFACFCVFLQHKKIDEQVMCFVCFCIFFQISGHKTNVLHKFLCFFVYKLLLLKSHHPCVLCVFVILQRSRVTTPMYFVCFCVFLPTLSLILVQTGVTTQCVL